MKRARKFYVFVCEPEGWDITCIENDQRKALDIFNEAKQTKRVHYIEVMAEKIGGPDINKSYRWDY